MSEHTTEQTTIEQAKAEVARLEAALREAKARVRELRPSKAKAEPKACACGCEEMTRGGDFLPGHDARFRGQLLKAIDAGDESAIAALLARPSLLHGVTEEQLRTRLGSEVRKQEAQVARKAAREALASQRRAEGKAKPAPKPKAKPRTDTVEAMLQGAA